MRRRRKKHVQQSLQFNRRGGARKGAGRPRKAARKRVAHTRRPDHDERYPVHVTLRVLPSVPNLRRRAGFNAVRKAMHVVLKRQGFRIAHMSIQGNHMHLICEACTKDALSRGMQSFKISAARQLNKALGRSGEVFADRYHAEVIKTPTQMRACLSYVLRGSSRIPSETAGHTRWGFSGCWPETALLRAVHRTLSLVPRSRAIQHAGHLGVPSVPRVGALAS